MGCDSLMRHDHGAVDKHLVLDLNVLSGDGEAVDPGPLADSVLPADDAAFNERIAMDLGALHDCGIVNSAAWANDALGSNNHIGSEMSCWVNFGRRIDQDLSSYGRSLGQTCRSLVLHRVEEQPLALKVILGLANVHPVSIKCEDIQVVLSCHFRENFSLD